MNKLKAMWQLLRAKYFVLYACDTPEERQALMDYVAKNLTEVSHEG